MKPIIQWRHQLPQDLDYSDSIGSKSYAGIPCECLADSETLGLSPSGNNCAGRLEGISSPDLDDGLPHPGIPPACLVRPAAHRRITHVPEVTSTTAGTEDQLRTYIRTSSLPAGLRFKRKQAKPPEATSDLTTHVSSLPCRAPLPLEPLSSSGESFILDTSLLPGAPAVPEHLLPPRPDPPQPSRTRTKARASNPAPRCPIRAFLNGLKPPLGLEAPVLGGATEGWKAAG